MGVYLPNPSSSGDDLFVRYGSRTSGSQPVLEQTLTDDAGEPQRVESKQRRTLNQSENINLKNERGRASTTRAEDVPRTTVNVKPGPEIPTATKPSRRQAQNNVKMILKEKKAGIVVQETTKVCA